jgi:hypothetical protein
MFTFDFYKDLLELILQHGYSFMRFDESVQSSKLIYLRHDVDISPICALRHGEIEQSLGIRSNFFFLIGSEMYNVFDHKNRDIIRELRKMGHCVGLHIDEREICDDEEHIYNTLKWFNDCVEKIDFVMSFHRPMQGVLYKPYKKFINSYQDPFFSPEKYLSDSKRSDAFYPVLLSWIKEEKPLIQLNLHPGWWYNEERDTPKYISDLIDRRNAEIRHYLKTHFNKVFGAYIQDENRTFGL